MKELSAKHHLPRALDLESVDPEAGKETSMGILEQSGDQATDELNPDVALIVGY